MNEFMAALKNYANFSGRASRRDYWMFFLIYILIYAGVMVLAAILPGMLSTLILSIFALGMLLPSLAVGVRRIHDSDHSGWFILISLVPIVGALYVLYLLIIEGTPGDNRFGPSPVASNPNAV